MAASDKITFEKLLELSMIRRTISFVWRSSLKFPAFRGYKLDRYEVIVILSLHSNCWKLFTRIEASTFTQITFHFVFKCRRSGYNGILITKEILQAFNVCFVSVVQKRIPFSSYVEQGC